ncbi:MAG: hypothetical protein IJK46_07455 [Prevotella sp.]|nr:hypothetical protein [Prevotella sp.]
MKHFRLLLTLLALTLGWTNVSAQSWTASEVETGNFHLYNVGKAQFLTRGNGWQTQASTGFNALTLIVEEYNGAYKLRTNVNGDGKGLERLSDPVIYTDQSAGKNSTWTFTKVADASNGPVYTIVSAENHGGGAGSYMTANADNTIVGPADAVTDDYGRWQLFQSWITNTMPVTNTDGWTVSETPTFDAGNICAEFWNKSGASIKQTVDNLPAGSYELIAVALTREGMTATLHAGTNTMNIAVASTSEVNNRAQANTWFNAGNGVNRLEFTHAGGSLEIGLTADNTTGDHWLVWRSFVLLYKGLDLSELKAALQAQIDAVPALEGTTTEAAYNAAKNYADGIDMDALTTEEAISAASTELANLVNAAVALQVPYSRYKEVKAACVAVNGNLDTTAADAEANAATTAEGVDLAIVTVRAALLTYLPTAEASEEAPIDLTNALIDNPTVSENVDYWNVENVGRPYDWSSGPTTNYGETEFYQSTFDFNQTLTLCKGTYEFGVTGFHRAGNHATYFYAGEDKVLIPGVESSVVNNMAEAKTYFDNGNGKVALKFALDNESNTLKIGIVNNDTETDRWTIFRNFTLKYFGSQIDLSSYEELLAAAVAAAEAVEGTVPSAVYQTLATVVSDNNQTYTTKDAYLTAIAAIEEATATAKAMQDPYNRYKTVKAAVVGISETISTTDADAQAEAATTTEALDKAVATLRTNLLAYLPTAEVAEGSFIDLTNAMIDNPTVRQNTSYWTIEGTPNGNYSWGKVDYEECEFYQQNFDFYQTLTLSKGTYEFGVTGFHRAGNHATYFYAGAEDRVLIPGVANDIVNTMTAAKEYFDGGNGKVALKFALEDESNTLKIGIVNNDAETDKWTIFRDFTLKYYGSQVDLSSYEEAWNEAVAAAEAAIAANPNVTGEELTAVNAAKADVPEQTKESYKTKTEALTNATAALIAAAPSYNLYAEKKALVDNFEALPYADPAKKPSTEGAEAPTNAEDAVTKANAFMPALRLYVESNALAEGVEGAVNLTSKIKQDAIADWTAEITGSNATFVLKNADGSDPDTYTAADGTKGRNLIDSGDLWGASSWTAKMTQSVKLTPGKYILTASARGSNDLTTFKLLADDKSVDMEHFGAAEGSGIFDRGFNDYYLEFELTEAKDVVIGFEAATEAAHNWCSVARFRLAQLEDKAVYATNEDLALLAESLQPTAKLGFDEGDYAPYNNVESLTAAEAEVTKVYAEIEAFDGKAMKSTVDAAIETINALEWTANTKEVNAVYDGTFASAENNGAPAGWTMSNNTLGGDYHSRAFVGDERMAEFNETNSGLFLRFDGTNSNRGSMYYYGNTTGYTMPLKANTNYYVKVDFAGWGSTGKPLRINITGPEGFTAVSMTENTSVRADNADETPQQFLVKFTTTEAGNYVINFQTPGSDDNKHNVVVSNLELFKEKALKGDVNGDGKVNVADVTALVNALQKGEQPAAGNLDGVEGVDANDVKALVELILHNE